MQLGMVGLGRMGANLVRRLVRDGHTCVVYDVSADAVTGLAAESDAITGATTLDEFVAALDAASGRVGHGAGRLRRAVRRPTWRRGWTPATS